MLTITLDKAGKKFNREWIFRQLSFTIHPGDRLAVLGGNGSGKSTLLQVISGYVQLNEGAISFALNGQAVPVDDINRQVSLASPYLQLIEDFTAPELITHIAGAKPFKQNLGARDILKIAELEHAADKYIRQYSSGMKQRLKLALAFLADTPLLLLDEPTSNLDRNGAAWYGRMVKEYGENRTIIVCSNAITEEYDFCTRQLNVMDHKV